jgi:hypothetical protein
MARDGEASGVALSDDDIFDFIDALDKQDEEMSGRNLEELFHNVHGAVRGRVGEAGKRLKDGATQANLQRYLELNGILLILDHWARDITVGDESPLSAIGEEADGMATIAPILRGCFQEMLMACSFLEEPSTELVIPRLASSRHMIRLHEPLNPPTVASTAGMLTDSYSRDSSIAVDRLDQLARHLKVHVSPLRTLLEDQTKSGNVQMVRDAAEQKSGKSRKRTFRKEKSLVDRLSKSLAESKFDTGATNLFAPEGILKELILPDTVRSVIGKMPSDGNEQTEQDLVDFIVFKANRLFAICIHLRLEGESLRKAMVLFMENSVIDKHLPLRHDPVLLEKSKEEDSDSDSDGSNSSNRENVSENEGFESKLCEIDPKEEIWTFSRRTAFYGGQWSFQAPVFSTAHDTPDLDGSCILPFPYRGKEMAGGGFGQVSQISIHPRHIKNSYKTVSVM